MTESQPWTTENLEAHTRETLAFQREMTDTPDTVGGAFAQVVRESVEKGVPIPMTDTQERERQSCPTCERRLPAMMLLSADGRCPWCEVARLDNAISRQHSPAPVKHSMSGR